MNLTFIQIWKLKRMNMHVDNFLLEIFWSILLVPTLIIDHQGITFGECLLCAQLSGVDFFFCILIPHLSIDEFNKQYSEPIICPRVVLGTEVTVRTKVGKVLFSWSFRLPQEVRRQQTETKISDSDNLIKQAQQSRMLG